MIDAVLADDRLLVAASFAWIFLVIALGEGVRRLFRLPPDVSRKVVHVGVALWALPTAIFFKSLFWAALCPLVFVILNAISYRFRLFDLIEEEGTGSPGTIYFPLSFAALILFLWPVGGRAAMVAGLYAMGLGDAAASVLGRRFGRHRYTVAGARKSWEGSAAMAGFSFAGILVGTYFFQWEPLWIPSLAAALVATAAEAPAGRGLDNLTVPISAALTFLLVQGLTA